MKNEISIIILQLKKNCQFNNSYENEEIFCLKNNIFFLMLIFYYWRRIYNLLKFKHRRIKIFPKKKKSRQLIQLHDICWYYFGFLLPPPQKKNIYIYPVRPWIPWISHTSSAKWFIKIKIKVKIFLFRKFSKWKKERKIYNMSKIYHTYTFLSFSITKAFRHCMQFLLEGKI